MIPLVCSDHEIEAVNLTIREAARSVRESMGCMTEYKTGTMLEVPRALIRADAIVQKYGVSFVSIGSNDLTQLIVSFKDIIGIASLSYFFTM